MRKSDNTIVKFMRDSLTDDLVVELSRERQAQLSKWTAKVALLIELYLHDEAPNFPQPEIRSTHLPVANFVHLFQKQKPTPDTSIWIGAASRQEMFPVWSIGGPIVLSGSATPGGTVQEYEIGYVSMFSLRSLVFRTVGFDSEVPAHVKTLIPNPDDIVPGGLIQIWPTNQDQVIWPPSHVMTKEEVGLLAHSRHDRSQD
jgi:hypothetical protein